MYLLKFNFILVLKYIFFCFNLIIIYYHTQKQRNMRFKELSPSYSVRYRKSCVPLATLRLGGRPSWDGCQSALWTVLEDEFAAMWKYVPKMHSCANSKRLITEQSLSLHSADVTEIRLMPLGNDNLTLCWFSMSFNCFVKAVNDGLACGSFCQQFIMIWYLRE